MRNLEKWKLAAILICGISVFTACSSNDENSSPIPQPDLNLAEKIVGKWMVAELNGEACPTNLKTVDLGVDAQINLARGVIVTKTTAPVTDGKEFFGPASFHENDYSFFYKNLQENVAKRIAAYKNNN